MILTYFKKLIISSLLILFSWSSPVAADAVAIEPTILILNSYSRDFVWTDDQTQGILQGIKDSGWTTNVRMEYLDWKNNPREERLSLLYDLFKEKYGHNKVDLVIATDDAALQFALQHRHTFFSDAPIVFSGVFPEAAALLVGKEKNVTGVLEEFDPEETLQLMLTMNPLLQQIFLLSDQTESGIGSKEMVYETFHKFRPDISIYDASVLPESEVIDKLGQLPANSAVLITTYVSDGTGKLKTPEQYVALYSAHSSAPVYVTYDFNMGSGALGGKLMSGRLQGEEAAKLGIRILQGEQADRIPFTSAGTTVTKIDYDQLVRYKLSVSRIPSNAVILNNPLELYEKNKTIVWSLLGIFLLLILYILVLNSNIKKRKAAEVDLKQKNEELGALYEEIYASQDELHYRYRELETVQSALRKSEERYKLSLAGANDGLWDWDVITGELYFSERCSKILETDVGELHSLADLLAQINIPENQASILAKLESRLATKRTHFSFEKQFRLKNSEKWLLIRGKVLLNEQESPMRVAGSLTDITERKENEEVIHYMAFHDTLTGLANRSALNNKLSSALDVCATWEKAGALFFIDIDNFKIINDLFGHSFGDQLLIVFAQRLKQGNEGAFIARMGGDEFVLLFEQAAEKEAAILCARNVIALFEQPIKVADKILHLTLSMGIAFFPKNGQTTEEILKNADLAMYQAKNQGKNQYVFFDYAMEAAIQKKALLEGNLRKALANGEIQAWYQPILDITTNQIRRFEALARWQSPEYGMVAPNEFIPIAEENGLILSLGQEILDQACRFVHQLSLAGFEGLIVTVNISAVQLMQPNFVALVRQAIADHSIQPGALGLEITESIFMQSFEENVIKLKELKQSGILIYLDDFGTGYSSLKYLKDLPIDVVKIDKSFIDGVLENQEDREFTQIIIRLAHLLKMKTVAEGVETADQLAILAGYQCDAAQGYLFSKPMPAEEVQGFLEKYKKK